MRVRTVMLILSSVVSVVVFVFILPCCAQVAPREGNSAPNFASQRNVGPEDQDQDQDNETQAQRELQKGTALTRAGRFDEAIPYLSAARGHVRNEYAAAFNLALCYIATHDFKKAIDVLNDLRRDGHDGVDVENLLAQAYIGSEQKNEALAAVQKAALIAPQNEKLYIFAADACNEQQDYSLGLKVTNLGLKNLPQSARLHYERAIFLWQLDEFDRAKEDFIAASELGKGTEVAYLSTAQRALFEGHISEAIQSAREGIGKGFDNSILLTVLGEALLRSGVSPGENEFEEARSALERSVAVQSEDASPQIALGQLDLQAGLLAEAIVHLEKARQLQPNLPSVYASLAKAYRRQGDAQAAQLALATLEKLNQAQAERISAAPGDRKAGYAARAVEDQ